MNIIQLIWTAMVLSSLAPQTLGELRVTVFDPSGVPVRIEGELLEETTRTRYSFSTDALGRSTLTRLPFGTYALELSAPGFENLRVTIVVDAATSLEYVATLVLAPVETSEAVRILPGNLDGVPGSTSEITSSDLAARRPFSIKEALRTTTGIHVVDEDAFGLNLNIGVRGLNPRRTQRTLLLEDGAPIHLAPYSDPSAHYHTPLERIDSIEFIKGSGQIVHGPQTVGG